MDSRAGTVQMRMNPITIPADGQRLPRYGNDKVGANMIYNVDNVCLAIFTRWRALCTGNRDVAFQFIGALRSAAKIGVFGNHVDTFRLLPMFAEMILESAEMMVAYKVRSLTSDGDIAIIKQLFSHPECGVYISSIIHEIQLVHSNDTGRPRDVHPALIPCIAPLLAHRESDTPSMAYDFDGLHILANKVLTPFDAARTDALMQRYRIESLVAEDECILRMAQTSPCARVTTQTFTCTPLDVVTQDAVRAVFVPNRLQNSYKRWIDQCKGDRAVRKLVEDCRHQIKQPGWSVATIIGSGQRGGFVGDRRKKRRAATTVADKLQSAMAPGATTVSRNSICDIATTNLDVANLDSILDIADTLADGNSRMMAAIAACRVDSMPTTTEIGTEVSDTTPHNVALIMPRIWSDPVARAATRETTAEQRIASVKSPELKRRRLALIEGFGLGLHIKDHDSEHQTHVAPHTQSYIEIELLSDPVRASNIWVDMRMSGPQWCRDMFPCGCNIAMLAHLINIVYKRVSMYHASAIMSVASDAQSQSVFRTRTEVQTMIALSVDLMCGTLTRTVANGTVLSSQILKNWRTFDGIAGDIPQLMRDIHQRRKEKAYHFGVPSNKGPPDNSSHLSRAHTLDDLDRFDAWAVGLSSIRQDIAECVMHTKHIGGDKDGRKALPTFWYFAHITRLEWIHQAHALATATGMHGRAAEIVATAMCTRHVQTRYGAEHQTGTTLPAEALVFEPPDAWPCDIAYATSLAADSMHMDIMCVGDVVPLTDSVAVVVLPGRGCRCVHRGTPTANFADGTDAYVAGSMAHMLGSGVFVRTADCALIYPFALLALLCSTAASAAQKTYEQRYATFRVDRSRWNHTTSGTFANASITKRRDGWDSLLWAAIVYLSDICMWSLREDTTGTQTDEWSWLDPLAIDTGHLVPEDPLFCEYRAFGKILVAAHPNADNDKDSTLVRRGIVCIARPKRRWSITLSAVRHLLGMPEMSDPLVSRLRSQLCDINSRFRGRHCTDMHTLVPTSGDFEECLATNVSLIGFLATMPDAVPLVLRSLTLTAHCDISDDFNVPRVGSRIQMGNLVKYDISTLGSPVYADIEPGQVNTQRPTSQPRGREEDVLCMCESYPVQKKSDDELSAANGKGLEQLTNSRIPEVLRLCSEFLKFTNDGNRDLEDVAEFIMKYEVRTKMSANWTTYVLPHQQKPVKYALPQRGGHTEMLRNACIDGWKRGGVPLIVMGCTGKMLLSCEVLPVADHPMSNPLAYPVRCIGCHQYALPRSGMHKQFSECLPYKHGPLMSEIVHMGTTGLCVLPYAHMPDVHNDDTRPPPNVADAPDNAKTGYPRDTIDHITGNNNIADKICVPPIENAHRLLARFRKTGSFVDDSNVCTVEITPPVPENDIQMDSAPETTSVDESAELDVATMCLMQPLFERETRDAIRKFVATHATSTFM